MTINVGFLVFANVQNLDLTGPHDLLSSLPSVQCHLVAKSLDPIPASSGFVLTPTHTFVSAPPIDVLVVPGGKGVDAAMVDAETLSWVIKTASTAKFITSVCTGSLLLGVCGLLRGKKATTHWGYTSLLSSLGAEWVNARVVRDGNVITGGGVTAGIDFALTVAAELVGEDTAMKAQLQIEYAPAPPFSAGSPETAPPAILQAVRANIEANSLPVRRQSIADGFEVVKGLAA